MTLENDVGVSLVDQDGDEDLLEYNEENEAGVEGKEENTFVNVVSEDEVRKAAEILLHKESPKVLVNYEQDSFFLFDYDSAENSDGQEAVPIILDNPNQIHQTCSDLFVSIRHFLENYYGRLSFMSKELLFEIPCLDLQLCEDNVYNNQMTFNDIHTIFNILKERSESQSESNVPPFLRANITTRPRFVSRYNALVELTQSNATFKNIRPFSNDKTHPLIVEDNVGFASEQPEHIIMNVDEDSEPVSMSQGYEEQSLNHGVADNNDSDELLEITDNRINSSDG